MSNPKIKIVNKLQYSPDEGLGFITDNAWIEALPGAYEWPGIPKTEDQKAYLRALHLDPAYQQAAREFFERQRQEPQRVLEGLLWAYKDQMVVFNSDEPENVLDAEKEAVLVKHHVLRRERQYEKLRREVEALENLEKLKHTPREPIPDSVRLFVWQRDKGHCVKCGSSERLEFDHIIPLNAGGSNTERNIQLLCEKCNRAKGSTI